MLLLEHISCFGILSRLSEFSSGGLFKWNKATQSMTLGGNLQHSTRIFKGKSYLIAFSTILIAYQSFVMDLTQFKSDMDPNSLLDSILGPIVVANHVVSLFCLLTMSKYASILTTYVNGHIQLGRTLNVKREDKLTLLERLNLQFAYMLVPVAFGLAYFSLFGMHWMTPCKPTLGGFWIIYECSLDVKPISIQYKCWQYISKFAVFLYETWVYQFSINVIPFSYGGILILCTLSFRAHLLNYERKCTSSDENKYETAIIYRRIQVLAILMNEYQRWGLTAVEVVIAITIQAGSLAGLVKLEWDSKNLFAISFLLMEFFCGASSSIGVMGAQATVYSTCESVLESLKRYAGEKGKGSRREHEWRQRFYKSCNCVKVGFGSINFIDTLTPLNSVDMANDLTVNILLLE